MSSSGGNNCWLSSQIIRLSLRKQQVPQVRRCLKNYYQLKHTLEQKAAFAKALHRGDAAVFKALADRAFGRLPQPIAVTGDAGGPIEIVFAGARPPWLPK